MSTSSARGAGRVALFLLLLTVPTGLLQPVQGWKPSTHVYLAMEVLREIYSDVDQLGNPKQVGMVPIYRVAYKMPAGVDVFNPLVTDRIVERIGEYALHPDLLQALRTHTAIYLAGVVGPDAFPDIATGQTRIHVDLEREAYANVPSDAWLRYLWRAALDENPGAAASPEARDRYLQKLAFVAGYLTHAAGDMYMHTFINLFAGGAFSVAGTTNGIRHMVSESYVGKRTPDLDALAAHLEDDLGVGPIGDPYAPEVTDTIFDFVYRHLVDAAPGTDLARQLLVEINPLAEGDFNPGNQAVFPRFMSNLKHGLIADTTQYAEALADFDERIENAPNPVVLGQVTAERLAFVGLNEPRIAYARNWIADIEDGLRAWPAFGNRVMRALTLNREGMQRDELNQAITDYQNAHLLSMLGNPDAVGDILGFINHYEQLLFPDAVRDSIDAWRDDFLDAYILKPFNTSVDEIEAIFKNPELRFDPVLTTPDIANPDGIPPQLVSLTSFNRDFLFIDDAGYQNPALRFAPYFFQPAYNTVTMTKLLLMAPTEVEALQLTLMCAGTNDCEEVPENALLGFVNSLDEGNEFRKEGSIYHDAGQMPPRGAMPFVGCPAYRELFMEQPGELNPCRGATAPPTIDPGEGVFDAPVTVTLSHPEADAQMAYALLDTDLSEAERLARPLQPYTGPFTAPAPLEGDVRPWEIRARATRPGLDPSETVAAQLTVDAQLAAPGFFPETENHTGLVNVTLSGPAGSTLFYTVNGQAPDYNATRYDGAIALGIGTHRIQAVAYRIGFTQSAVVERTYRVFSANADRTEDPTFRYASFSGFAGATVVDMASTTQGAEIRYEILKDAAPPVPTEDSPLFTEPFDVGVGNWFIRAIAFSPGLPPSNLVQVNYNVNEPLGVTETPTFTPAPGVYANDIEVTIAAETSPPTQGVRIFFTTDGSAPPTSPVTAGNYSAPFTLARSTTVRAQAARSFFPFSGIGEATYELQAAAPVIAPDGAVTDTPVTVTLASDTEDAVIYYTLDGSEPNEDTARYDAPLTLSQTATLRARAFKDGYTFSALAEAVFTVNTPAAPVFVAQPVAREVPEGEAVTFTSRATGFPEPSIAWSKDGQFLEGATGDTLTLPAAAVADAGVYRAFAVNSQGSVFSDEAALTVFPTPQVPTITRQPDDVEVAEDGQAVFTAEAAGVPAPGYQWYRNGSPLPSQVGPSLVFNEATLALAGTYTVVASNVAGADTSRQAVLTVVVQTGLATHGDLPLAFGLDANYPNPFSDLTHIPFAVASEADVRITLFDLQGRRLAVLLDRTLPPGRYTASFDGNGLASGTYFYRIQAGDFEATRTMVRVR